MHGSVSTRIHRKIPRKLSQKLETSGFDSTSSELLCENLNRTRDRDTDTIRTLVVLLHITAGICKEPTEMLRAFELRMVAVQRRVEKLRTWITPPNRWFDLCQVDRLGP
ncbi:hypothetical protein RchiOBHm_Chr4g0434091 [Rosa chinensis]|uniref:Uncharacterized protein n=1 Tax=Rosa chinensis TaxID=74649 RepID=A0A2P6R1G8_ROSCH|nr:hypothetical protein RchiOBHm_Chr4g0434091 [Rosa chinensis]